MEDRSLIKPELIINHTFPESTYTYNERDVALYALSVGACATNALDDKELKYVYHKDGQQFIKVLPTFAAIYPPGLDTREIPGSLFDPCHLLHVQQYTEIYRRLPTCGCMQDRFVRFNDVSILNSVPIRNKTRVAGLHDKGKAVVLEIEVTSYEDSSDEPIFMNRFTLYLKGAGRFSKSPHSYSYSDYPTYQSLSFKHTKTQPFAVYEDCTQPSQALLFRPFGGFSPLHSDPTFAQKAGFSRPIMHGLCTLGFALKAIIRCICGGDPDMVKSISGRFLHHVYPGESLRTEMWVEDFSVMYQVKVKQSNKSVLSGVVSLNRPASSL